MLAPGILTNAEKLEDRFLKACRADDLRTVKKLWTKVTDEDEDLVSEGLDEAVDQGSARVALYIKNNTDTWNADTDNTILEGRVAYVNPAIIAAAMGDDRLDEESDS